MVSLQALHMILLKWILPGEQEALVVVLPVSPWVVFFLLSKFPILMPPSLALSPFSTHTSWASELATFPLFLFWEPCPSENWPVACFCPLSLGSVSLSDRWDQETSEWSTFRCRLPLWTTSVLDSHALLPHWDHSCFLNDVTVIPLLYDN